jgi:hypothetical protein
MMGTLLMNSVEKFCWSLLIALYLFSPNSNLVTSNQNFQDNGPSGKSYISASTSSATIGHSLSNCVDDDSDIDESDSFYPSHIPMAPFSAPNSPLTAHFDTTDKVIPLPEVYSSIFVPPQEIS